MKLLHSRHLEYLILSILVPLGAVLGLWVIDAMVLDLKSPGVTQSHLIVTTAATCIMIWWAMSIVALAQNPGYGRYAFYIFLLPAWTIVVNIFLDNNHRTLMGLDMEVMAVMIVAGLTWVGSLVVCCIDWYQFNHKEFKLTQHKLK